MPLDYGTRPKPRRVGALTIVCSLTLLNACAMAGFGGLQLNVTDQQTRQVVISIDAGSDDARVVEIDATGEVDIGVGRTTIERYVLHRTGFGSAAATGFFLCPKPCADPLAGYVVAYSPERIFSPDGQLELHFRIVNPDGSSRELTRSVEPEMLPDLWQNPRIDASASGNQE